MSDAEGIEIDVTTGVVRRPDGRFGVWRLLEIPGVDQVRSILGARLG